MLYLLCHPSHDDCITSGCVSKEALHPEIVFVKDLITATRKETKTSVIFLRVFHFSTTAFYFNIIIYYLFFFKLEDATILIPYLITLISRSSLDCFYFMFLVIGMASNFS